METTKTTWGKLSTGDVVLNLDTGKTKEVKSVSSAKQRFYTIVAFVDGSRTSHHRNDQVTLVTDQMQISFGK
jgi:hypothetical protein